MDATVQSVFCFNTQPPEGGCNNQIKGAKNAASFNTQPPEGGCGLHIVINPNGSFQHTAA